MLILRHSTFTIVAGAVVLQCAHVLMSDAGSILDAALYAAIAAAELACTPLPAVGGAIKAVGLLWLGAFETGWPVFDNGFLPASLAVALLTTGASASGYVPDMEGNVQHATAALACTAVYFLFIRARAAGPFDRVPRTIRDMISVGRSDDD